jgi:hypothetical protein
VDLDPINIEHRPTVDCLASLFENGLQLPELNGMMVEGVPRGGSPRDAPTSA